jgi:hypothetical protein
LFIVAQRVLLVSRRSSRHGSGSAKFSGNRLDDRIGAQILSQAITTLVLVRKSIRQKFTPTIQLLSLMEDFRQMTNDCIRIGLEFEERNRGMTLSMKKLSLLAYGDLRTRYGGYSQYALCAISKAAGILSARRKSMRRGYPTKRPYLSKLGLVSCYGFNLADGCASLIIHLDAKTFETIPLSNHTRAVLTSSDPLTKVRAFTLTQGSLSLCIAKELQLRRRLK